MQLSCVHTALPTFLAAKTQGLYRDTLSHPFAEFVLVIRHPGRGFFVSLFASHGRDDICFMVGKKKTLQTFKNLRIPTPREWAGEEGRV